MNLESSEINLLVLIHDYSQVERISLDPFYNCFNQHILSMPIVSIASHSVSDNRNNVSQVLIRDHAGKLCKATTVDGI